MKNLNKVAFKLNDNVNYKEMQNLYKEMGSSKGIFKAEDIFHYSLRTKTKEINSLKNCILVTSRINKKLIGAAKIITDAEYIYYIYDIMVCPKYQNKGIGSKLIKKSIAYAKKRKFIKIILTAIPGKEEYYRKFGFNLSMSPVMTIRGEEHK